MSILLNHKNVIHEVRVSGTGRYKYTCRCDAKRRPKSKPGDERKKKCLKKNLI